ncbi:MAG TPA: hypothetical protein VGF74_01590 [Thermoleophilaceae bacterium]|jgi:hypothetical protein
MSKSTISQLVVGRRILIRVAIAVVGLFLLALVPGAVGRTFWVAFVLGVLVLVGLAIVSFVQARRSRAS